MKLFKEALSYDDVLLRPQYSDIESRREISLVSNLGEYKFELPIIASPIAAAIPITGDFVERAQKLVEAGVDILCVDVAHGHHIMMKDALSTLKRNLPSHTHIMAGNVATRKGYEALVDWGADSVRVGIGGGSICSTRVQTGHASPPFNQSSTALNRNMPAKGPSLQTVALKRAAIL